MKSKLPLALAITLAIAAAPLIFGDVVLAADPAGVTATKNFIKNVITIIASFGSIVAIGFIVWGGFLYASSSGNPDNLERAKRTIFFAGLGLAIVVGAFVIGDAIAEVASNAFGS